MLANEGFDPAFGARPFKRAIQRLVENPLALEILAGKFLPGETIEGNSGRRSSAIRKEVDPIFPLRCSTGQDFLSGAESDSRHSLCERGKRGFQIRGSAGV